SCFDPAAVEVPPFLVCRRLGELPFSFGASECEAIGGGACFLGTPHCPLPNGSQSHDLAHALAHPLRDRRSLGVTTNAAAFQPDSVPTRISARCRVSPERNIPSQWRPRQVCLCLITKRYRGVLSYGSRVGRSNAETSQPGRNCWARIAERACTVSHPGRTIFLGSIALSNSSAVTKPDLIASSRSVVPLPSAALAIPAALS